MRRVVFHFPLMAGKSSKLFGSSAAPDVNSYQQLGADFATDKKFPSFPTRYNSAEWLLFNLI